MKKQWSPQPFVSQDEFILSEEGDEMASWLPRLNRPHKLSRKLSRRAPLSLPVSVFWHHVSHHISMSGSNQMKTQTFEQSNFEVDTTPGVPFRNCTVCTACFVQLTSLFWNVHSLCLCDAKCPTVSNSWTFSHAIVFCCFFFDVTFSVLKSFMDPFQTIKCCFLFEWNCVHFPLGPFGPLQLCKDSHFENSPHSCFLQVSNHHSGLLHFSRIQMEKIASEPVFAFLSDQCLVEKGPNPISQDWKMNWLSGPIPPACFWEKCETPLCGQFDQVFCGGQPNVIHWLVQSQWCPCLCHHCSFSSFQLPCEHQVLLHVDSLPTTNLISTGPHSPLNAFTLSTWTTPLRLALDLIFTASHLHFPLHTRLTSTANTAICSLWFAKLLRWLISSVTPNLTMRWRSSLLHHCLSQCCHGWFWPCECGAPQEVQIKWSQHWVTLLVTPLMMMACLSTPLLVPLTNTSNFTEADPQWVHNFFSKPLQLLSLTPLINAPPLLWHFLQTNTQTNKNTMITAPVSGVPAKLSSSMQLAWSPGAIFTCLWSSQNHSHSQQVSVKSLPFEERRSSNICGHPTWHRQQPRGKSTDGEDAGRKKEGDGWSDIDSWSVNEDDCSFHLCVWKQGTDHWMLVFVGCPNCKVGQMMSSSTLGFQFLRDGWLVQFLQFHILHILALQCSLSNGMTSVAMDLRELSTKNDGSEEIALEKLIMCQWMPGHGKVGSCNDGGEGHILQRTMAQWALPHGTVLHANAWPMMQKSKKEKSDVMKFTGRTVCVCGIGPPCHCWHQHFLCHHAKESTLAPSAKAIIIVWDMVIVNNWIWLLFIVNKAVQSMKSNKLFRHQISLEDTIFVAVAPWNWCQWTVQRLSFFIWDIVNCEWTIDCGSFQTRWISQWSFSVIKASSMPKKVKSGVDNFNGWNKGGDGTEELVDLGRDGGKLWMVVRV